MALITEDGTMVAGAESYAAVADADLYFSNRGSTLWPVLAILEKEQALRRASDYMSMTYRTSLKGVRISPTQSLDWPRYYVQLSDVGFAGQPVYVPANTVPAEVKKACCELALLAAAGPLKTTMKQNVLSKKVGPITVDYDPYSPQYNRYPIVEALMQIYIRSGSSSNTMRLSRT